MIKLIMMVCTLGQPELCEERNLLFEWGGSPTQCAMGAQPYIAQWVGEHPRWTIRNYHCEYPGQDKADGAARRT